MRWSPFALLDAHRAPAPDPDRVAWLSAQPFAHRGLHGGEGRHRRIENSRAAFAAAIAAGHGIECDVQLSRDGIAFVFHDDTLDRLAGRPDKVASLAADDLAGVALIGSDERIARLSEMLRLVGGQAPLLIEIKSRNRRVAPICKAVVRALEGYRGPLAIMSFNPLVGGWFAHHAPGILRGLVVTEEGHRTLRSRIQRHLWLWRSHAQFLAYDIRDLPSRFATAQRARGLPVVTWTVRSAEQLRRAIVDADAPIHEMPLEAFGKAPI